MNFIMWEQHGRAGYKYSATMKEVCHWGLLKCPLLVVVIVREIFIDILQLDGFAAEVSWKERERQIDCDDGSPR